MELFNSLSISRNSTGLCVSMPGGGAQLAGAPGTPLSGAGTKTAFLSSVSETHWLIRLASLSLSFCVLPVGSKREKKDQNSNLQCNNVCYHCFYFFLQKCTFLVPSNLHITH